MVVVVLVVVVIFPRIRVSILSFVEVLSSVRKIVQVYACPFSPKLCNSSAIFCDN